MDPIKMTDLSDTHKSMAVRYLFAKYGFEKDTQGFLKKLKDGQISNHDAQDYLRQLERIEKKS